LASGGGSLTQGGADAALGEAWLRQALDRLRDEIRDYYGALNEIEMGLKPARMPEKPEALVLYEQCQTLGIPLVQGGVRDQPHIWLMEVAVCVQERELWQTLREASRRQETHAAVSDRFAGPGV
jgi:hypothetical protein